MRRTPLVVAVVLSAALVACGGDGSESAKSDATTTTALSPEKQPWANAADEICATSNAQVRAIPPARNLDELKREVDEEQRLIGEEEKRLRQLTPPPGDVGAVNAFFDQVHRVAASLGTAREAMDHADRTAYSAAMADVRAANREAARLARSNGLVGCAGLRGRPGGIVGTFSSTTTTSH